MSRRFSNRKAALFGSVQALRSAFGGAATTGLALVMVLVFASIGWFSDALSELLFPENQPLWRMLPLLVLLLIIGKLISSTPMIIPEIIQHSPPSATKVLIWFLSPPGKGMESVINPEKMRSWRMSHEAIMAHKDQNLEKVVVLASSDASGKKPDGTWRYFDSFKETMSQSTGISVDKILMTKQNPTGVDFENAKHLFDALDGIYLELKNEGYKDADIILDVTGGQKMPGVLGGIIGLGEGKRIQYISTRDYKVHEYNITYKANS